MRDNRRVRRGVVALVVVASAFVTALALAQVPTNPSAGHKAAQRILAKVQLPPGAVAAASDPSGGTLAHPGAYPATPNLIDLHRFWRVPGDPAEVFDWIKAHRPAGSGASYSGASGDKEGITAQWMGFSVGGSSKTLVFGVAAARGGGSALRVDAQVVWVLERSPTERIPAGVHAVKVSEQRLGGPPRGPWTITTHARLADAAALIDRLPASQPGLSSCPSDTGPYVTLAFLSPSGANLATAVVDGSGCLGVTLSIDGRQRHGLEGNAKLVGELSRALGVRL
jgi:hypothetical protein